MKAEYQSLVDKETWILVDKPDGVPIIKCKWVFTRKRDKDGNVERYKSRLVAKGCSQKFGVNYTETFSPVTRYSTVRTILALAAELKLYVHQIDVTTAYLNGEIDADIYMAQPQMFEDTESPDKVCKLQKALYGLKQSGRKWNEKLDEILKKIGFKQCVIDPCVYTMSTEKDIIILVVYVDDILLASSNEYCLKHVKCQIGTYLEIHDKGPVGYFLGMEIERNTPTGPVKLSQKNMIMELLKGNGMENTRKVSTPLDPGQKFKKCTDGCINCKKADIKRYQSLIGSLMYIGLCTRPDILHAVTKLSQFNNDPHIEHMNGSHHILRYLNSTINQFLEYKYTGKP